jgi:DNA repair protein RadC
LGWTIKIKYIELVSLGGMNKTIAEPMQVFRVGVLKGAIKMILIHNHPSGELMPSEADKDITDRLLQAGNILEIEVIDHLIIAEKTYLSFEDTGLLTQIRQSKRYVPDYLLKPQLKKEVEEITAREATDKRNREIALQMRTEGYSVDAIVKLTGLTKDQIKKLK